jgi:hypothetical protein
MNNEKKSLSLRIKAARLTRTASYMLPGAHKTNLLNKAKQYAKAAQKLEK